MNEEYLKELYGYIGGEEAVGGSFDEWKSHMVANPQAQKDMFGYLGGEEAVGGTYEEWLNHTGIGKQTEIPIEGISDVVKKKEVGEEVSEPLEQPTTSGEKFEEWEIDLFKHFDDNPESLKTASNIDVRKYNEYKNTPTEFTEDEIAELEAIDKNPRALAWGDKQLREKYAKYKKQQNKPLEATSPLKKATAETEEQKSLFDMASSNVNEWYSSMGGMTPLQKMEVFKTKIDPLYKAYEQDVLYAETQEDLDKINSDFKEQTSQIAQELALDVTEDGSVKPFEDEVEKYKDRLETELRIGAKRLSEQERDSYLNDVADRLAAGTSSFSANMVDLVGFLTGANYFEGYRNLSEGQRFRAEQFREQSQRYDGTIQELTEQGNVGQAAGLAVMSAVESLPAMIPVFANPTYGIYVMGAGAGIEEYRSIEDKDIPEWKKVAMSVSAGMNEAVWEKAVTVPILAKSKQAMLSMGKRQGKDVIKKAIDASLKNSAYKANGQMPEWVAEGLSEVATGVSNDIAAKIYVDPDTQIGSHAFDDFTVGAVMGKVFSIPSNAVSKLEKMEQKKIVQGALESIPDDVDFETTLDLLEVISERDALVQMENKLSDEFKGKYRAKIIELTDKANEISNKYYAEKTGKEIGEVETVGDSQQKIDYLIEKGVKIPDGTTGEQLDEIFNAEKEKEAKAEEKTKKEAVPKAEATPPTEEEVAKEAEKPTETEEKPSQKEDEFATEEADIERRRQEELDESSNKVIVGIGFENGKHNLSTITKNYLDIDLTESERKELREIDAEEELSGKSRDLLIRRQSLTQRVLERLKLDGDFTAKTPDFINAKYDAELEALNARIDNKLKEETKDDEKVQEQQVQEQDEKRQTEKPTKEEQVSEAGTETRQEDVVQEEVKVKSFKKGDGGTKGTFKDDSGTVYKSLVPTEARIVDGKAERVPMEGKTTDEYDILSELQDRDYVPKIGKKVSTSEGEAFEIEELQEAESISIDEYKELRRQLQELEDDGYFIGDNVSVMRRNGKLVITDFSNAYKGSRGGTNMDYVSSVHDLLKPIDKAIVESTLSAMNVREVSDLVGEDVEPNTYLLTQRPPSIGTHPADGLIEEPKETRMGDRTVWELQYNKPLSDADIKRYELNPVLSMKEYGGMMVDGVSGNIPFYIRNIDGRTVTLAAVNPKGKTIENAMRTSELVAGVNSGKYKLINPSLEPTQPVVEAKTEQKGTITPTEEKVAEKPSKITPAEEKKVEKATGIKPKNLRDVFKAGREVFGLNRSQALAQAIIVDRVIGKIAKRRGVSKGRIYSTVEFKKSKLKDLTPQARSLYQAVWHGSPHAFEKFTTDKIGTGEGAQAFGWGLYFTDRKDIAESYADMDVSRQPGYFDKMFNVLNEFQVDGIGLSNIIGAYQDEALNDRNTNIVGVVAEIRDIARGRIQPSRWIPSDVVEYIKDNSDKIIKKFENERNLYKVNLHGDRAIDDFNYLRWDKPLTREQRDVILKALGDRQTNTRTIYGNPRQVINNESTRGSDVYSALSYELSPKEASLFLLRAGIDGIKYPTEITRKGTHEESFNYVIFDENVAEIEEHIKFQKGQGAKGAIQFMEDGNAIIHALTDPNVSTPLHEIAHLYEKYMTKSERDAVLRWAKTKEWNVDTSEKFARGFEKYLAEGVAPNEALKRVFDRFKAWLTDIYNGITGSEIDIELNDEMRGVYNAMLGEGTVRPRQAKKPTYKESFKSVDDLLFQDGTLYQGEDVTQRHTQAVNNLIDEYEKKGTENMEQSVRAYLEERGNPVSEEIINNVLKQRGYAKGYESAQMRAESKQKEKQGQRDSDMSKGDGSKLQDGEKAEEEKVEEVLKETQRVLKSRKGSKVVSHFAARMTLDETNLSNELKERISNNRMGMHDILTDEEADAIAENIIKNNSLSDIQKLSMNERIHPSIRVGLFVGAHKILASEEKAATEEGRTADAEMWGDEAYDYYQRFNNDAARKAGQLLRRLGTDLVMNEFAPYAWVGMYKNSVDKERIELTNTSSHKKSRQKFTKAAKESRQRAIDKTVAELDSIVKTKDIKEKVEKLKKKESELIAKWKKARKESTSVAVIPYLTQADIEFGSQILLVKLERFGYNQALAIKSLIKTFKGVGVDLKEEDAKKLLPDEIDGMTVDEKERQNEIEKHAMRVAYGIVSEVVERKQKDDPVQRMINTLLGKFKERDTDKKKKEPKSDLGRIAEAIRKVDEYADVWAEANAVAIDEINKNDKLSPQQKQEAIDRVNRAYKEATSFSFTEAQVDRAIKRKMKDLDMRVKDVVKEFLPLQSINRARVLQSMLEDTGLDGKQAEKLSQAVLNRFDKILASEKTSLIDKYIGKVKDGKTNLSEHKNKQKKTAISELLELVNIGAFDSAEFRDAYATAVGIRNFDAEVAEEIKKTAKAIQSEKEDIRKHKMSQDLLKTIAFYGGLKFSDAANAVWYTNVLGNIKTQERNIFGGISGVTSRLMAEAIGTGRVLPIIRGVFRRGFKHGWQRFRDVWKEGYAPFSDRLEIPNTAEVFRMYLKGTDKGIVQWMWNSMKYVGRFMNGADLLNATVGKEGFAELLAHEALGVNRAKYAFNPKYRKQINQEVDEYLHVGKAEVDRYRTEIEEDSKRFGYSDEDKNLILLDKIDKARPIELTEESTRFGIYSTGNVSSYGTLGLISEMLKWSLKGIGMPVWKNRKTGEVTYVAPLALFAAFTKIAGNIGSMSLNFVPLAGIPRIVTGKYGGHFSWLGKKGLLPQGTKYVVDLTEREKRSIINMQVMGTIATAALFGLSDGGDDDDPLIQITANLTGDYKKNAGIQDAEEYSLGIKLPNDKRLWISYKYTPLITMLAPIGYYRDAYKYRNEDRTSMDVLQESYLKIPFFLSDMTAIASMTDVIEKSISNTGQLDQLAKSLQRTISSFYTPSIYRDVTNMVEFLYGGTAPLSKKSGVVLDPNNLHERFMGRSPIAVAERIIDGEPSMYSVDVLGRTMPTKQVWNELVSISDGSDVYNATYDNHISKMGGLTAPDPSKVFFNIRSEDGGFTKIRLYLHDKEQAEVWYNYCKKRADMIFRAMQVYSNLDEEQYKKEMETEISRASAEAKLQAEAELMQQPIDKIKKWQIKR